VLLKAKAVGISRTGAEGIFSICSVNILNSSTAMATSTPQAEAQPPISYSDLATYIESIGPADLILRFCGQELHAHRSVLQELRYGGGLYAKLHAAHSGIVQLDHTSASAVKGMIAECYGLRFDGFDTYFKCECGGWGSYHRFWPPTVTDARLIDHAKYLASLHDVTVCWASGPDTTLVTNTSSRFRHCLKRMLPTSGYPLLLDEIIRHIWTEYHEHEVRILRILIIDLVNDHFAQMLWRPALSHHRFDYEEPLFKQLMMDHPNLCFEVLAALGLEVELLSERHDRTSRVEVE
jgi:hypothetical protein